LLINGGWTLGRARALATRIERSAPAPSPNSGDARITGAFRLAYGREPDSEERAEAASFLASQARRVRSSDGLRDHEALVDLCHSLLNSSEFLYAD
jgi:hypothetical protein